MTVTYSATYYYYKAGHNGVDSYQRQCYKELIYTIYVLHIINACLLVIIIC